MNKKRRIIQIVAIAAFIIMAGGCASLNQENFLPKFITPVANDQRINGSVNVQVVVPDVNRSNISDQQLVGFHDISYGKFFFSQDTPLKAIVPEKYNGRVSMYHSGMLRIALEKAITQKGLFQRIEQGNADYVLDVWVIDAIRLFDVFGEGMTIDLTSIWRLIRVKDGKIIICDFASGHGTSHGIGTNGYVEAIETATREMIQKGLSKLSDKSTHLAAMYVAGDWPSMGSVIPEGYRKIKDNWSQLREGLTEEEVRKIIPSMNSSCSIKRLFDSRFSRGPVEKFPTGSMIGYTVNMPCGWITQVWQRYIIKGSQLTIDVMEVIFEPFYPFYNLTFVNGVLQRWELSK